MNITNAENNSRIAKNTLLLYFRMLLTVAVSLYTVRLVLQTLGEVDYGIYNVVGGVVAMFSFLSGTMASASQRFFAFELGRGNFDQLKRIFSSTMIIYLIIGFIVVALSETVGIWFVKSQLTIPLGRLDAAKWVFRFSVLTFMLTLIAVPYNALIIAHEKMRLYAYISIIEVVLKLLSVYLLVVSSFDTLKLYSILIFLITAVVTMVYYVYCRRNFIECRFSFSWNSKLFKNILSYSSWNLIGNLGVVLKEQGTNILLNIFFSPVINAARGIAFQLSTVLNSFVTNFQMALNPQIVKSYSSTDYSFFNSLISRGARYSYYLLFLLSLPILLGTNFVLGVWLKQIPAHTISFVRLIIIASLIDSLYRTVLSGHLATGNIKYLQIIVGGINLALIPICYIFLRLNYSPEWVYILGICFSLVGLFLRLILFKKVCDKFSVKGYIFDVIFNVLKISCLSLIAPVAVFYFYHVNGILSFISLGLISSFSILASVYFVGINDSEKDYLISFIKKTIQR